MVRNPRPRPKMKREDIPNEHMKMILNRLERKYKYQRDYTDLFMTLCWVFQPMNVLFICATIIGIIILNNIF